MEEAGEALDERSARLMSLAGQLVQEHGAEGAARMLGVERRTLAAAMTRGAPSRRVRAALERLAGPDGAPGPPDERGRLEAMEDGLRALKGRVDELDASVREGLDRAVEAAGSGPGPSGQVRDLVVRVARLERGAEGSPERLDALEEGVALLLDRVEALDALDTEVRAGLDRVISLVGSAGPAPAEAGRVDALSRRLARLEGGGEGGSPAGPPGRIPSLEGGVRALEARFDSLDAEVRERLGRVLELAGRADAGAGAAAGPAGGDRGPEAPLGGAGEHPPPIPGDGCRTGVVAPERYPGEEEAYGAASALVTEWRSIRGRRGGGTGLERARIRERVMELEVEILGEGGLTLPPETEPLHPTRRAVQLGWRRRELHALRIERARREALEWLRRALTLGLRGAAGRRGRG